MTERLSSFAADLSALLAAMPGRTATAAQRADWYDRKAELLDRVAVEDASPANAAEAAQLARAAREAAARHRSGGPARCGR